MVRVVVAEWTQPLELRAHPGLRCIPLRRHPCLRGEVLAIGGLKEKLLAALRGGITVALIPHENVKDLAEIPDNVKEGIEIIPVKWIDEVLGHALEKPLTAVTEPEEVVAEVVKPATAAKAGGLAH